MSKAALTHPPIFIHPSPVGHLYALFSLEVRSGCHKPHVQEHCLENWFDPQLRLQQ